MEYERVKYNEIKNERAHERMGENLTKNMREHKGGMRENRRKKIFIKKRQDEKDAK